MIIITSNTKPNYMGLYELLSVFHCTGTNEIIEIHINNNVAIKSTHIP